MNFAEAVISVFRNCVNFSGRACRSEYWWFALFSLISHAFLYYTFLYLVWIVGGAGVAAGAIYGLALALPALAVTVRRLHDTDRMAWWILLSFTPGLALSGLLASIMARFLWDWSIILIFAGGVLVVASLAAWIWFIVMMILPGTAGPNRYGPEPLRPEPDSDGGGQAATAATPPDIGAGAALRPVRGASATERAFLRRLRRGNGGIN